MGAPPEPPYGQQPYGQQPYWQQPEGEPQYVPQPPPYQGYGPPPYGYPQAFPPGYPPGYPYPGQPGYGYPAAPAGPVVGDPVLGWLSLGASLLAVLAGLLPWASVFGIDVYNAGGDGSLVIGCAVVAGACGVAIGVGRGRLWACIAVTVFGMLIGLIGLIDAANVSNLAAQAQVAPGVATVTVGSGLWLTMVSGVLITGLGAVAIVRRRPSPAPR